MKLARGRMCVSEMAWSSWSMQPALVRDSQAVVNREPGKRGTMGGAGTDCAGSAS